MDTLAPLLDRMTAAARVPVVLYVHDCRGLGAEAAAWGERLGRDGYAVIAPDSRARSDDGTLRCAPSGGLAEATREGEIRYALGQIRTLSWVRQSAVFLLAVGEGAAAAARDDTLALTGSIVIGEAAWPVRASPSLRLEGAGAGDTDYRAAIDFLRNLTPR
jgi:dienelactone hydrolase